MSPDTKAIEEGPDPTTIDATNNNPEEHSYDRARNKAMSAHKRRDVGRAGDGGAPAWKRERNQENKRQKLERDDYKPPIYATEFTKDEIAAEERKPKRKVAVMIGYSGTGYYGMQANHSLRTIEGDLFQALVKAGAVSKANADDPKKISFARCARTDKGVHAAGNVVSLKLIIEDEGLVQKINDHLSPQIRVWGVERTRKSFSAYTLCDSRMYEYLIPTHCFLPPHPDSFMGSKLAKIAEEMNDVEGFNKRQADVAEFWSQADTDYIKPTMDLIDPQVRDTAYRRVFEGSGDKAPAASNGVASPNMDDPTDAAPGPQLSGHTRSAGADKGGEEEHQTDVTLLGEESGEHSSGDKPKAGTPLDIGMRQIKSAILAAKKAWRITPERLALVQGALSRYVGVHNYHNYTVQKQFKDPAAKRVIKSFQVDGKPILIGDTEWLSLKVHGQSFMMHQIRKMVGMAALAVRCGTDLDFLAKSMGPDKLSIPRAPGLGLLLERPIFEGYNQMLKTQQGEPDRAELGFDKYTKGMEEFKAREIYARIYREEEAFSVFHQLFWAIDQLKQSDFLYLSSKGLAAVTRGSQTGANLSSGDGVDMLTLSEDEGEHNEDS